MDVVALLPPPLLAHLRRVLGVVDDARRERTSRGTPVPESAEPAEPAEPAGDDGGRHALTEAVDWGDLARGAQRGEADIVVVDPLVEGVSRVGDVGRILERQPSLPVLVYTTLSPAVARATVELARLGVEHVLLHRFDDEPKRMLKLIERLPGVRLSDDLLARLATPLAALPVSLQRAVERLFRYPKGYDTAVLARSAGVSVRTLYRELESAGFASPAVVVRGARLLRAYSLLQAPRVTADDVAARMKYSSRQHLARHVRQAFGTTVAGLKKRTEPAELVERLAAMVYPGPGAVPGADDGMDDLALDEEPDMDARQR